MNTGPAGAGAVVLGRSGLAGGQVLMHLPLETGVLGRQAVLSRYPGGGMRVCLSGASSSVLRGSLLTCRPGAGKASEEVFPLLDDPLFGREGK